MADGASSSPGRSTRMSRNAACTRCRNSKVRCNPSSTAGRPCQRCAKLQLSCVVDANHRRTTRKSQLDQLAREVQAIKDTVDSSNRRPALQPSSSPSAWSQRLQGTNETSPSSVTAVPTQSAFATAASEYSSRQHENGVIVDDAPVDSTAVPSLPRALNSQPFTGPEIDEHFSLYFRRCHPHFPILSQRDPNKCYDMSPFVFWVIVLISCRSRSTHCSPATNRLLTEHVKHETDAVVLKVPQPLPQLHAILLVAAWGLYPDVRFINDPAYWLSGIAMNSCLLLGFHTGSGRHHDYSHVTLPTIASDREAAVTWAASSILSRRLSTNLGVPCTAPLNKATLNIIHDEGSSLPTAFRVQLECQVFIDRVNKTLGPSLEECNRVPPELVRMLEDEWVAVRARIIARHTDAVISLHALFVLLKVQLYYFLPVSTQNSQPYTAASSYNGPCDILPPSIEADILRCYTTASTIITRAVELDEMTNLLKYLPLYTIRPIAHAVCVIFRVIRSNLPPRYSHIVVPEEATKVSADTVTVCRRVSVVEGDLAWRLARFVERWDATSAPYLAAAAATAAVAANPANAATGHDNEHNDSGQATSTGAGLDYEPVLVETFRQRMVAASGFDFMIRWKKKHGPVHLGPYGPQSRTQNLGMQVNTGGAGGYTGHQQRAPSASFSGTSGPVNSRCQCTASGPDASPTEFQRVQDNQQQTGMQANLSGATMLPGEAGPSLPFLGTMDADSLLETDWGFLDDFGWGSNIPAP